jgi:hypothetical protein
MSSEPRTLSLPRTYLLKIVFPFVWIGAFAFFTLSLFLSPESWRDANGGLPEGMKWIFLFLTLTGAAVLGSVWMPLKRIRMDDESLYISNYLTEIIVPLENVAEVTENRWLGIHPLTMRFRSRTQFGSRVKFMPNIRWFDFWSPHPAVEEIRAAVRGATGGHRG